MNFGERLYELRKEKNLSQGDLAGMLGVSRQSVSKWENNNSVPDLEKIVKLSEIFGVSTDSLVKNETVEFSENENTEKTKVKKKSDKTAGIILLCMSVAFILFLKEAGILFSIPIFICGIICLTAKKNKGFLCAWAVIILTDIYIRYASGINWTAVKLTFSSTPYKDYLGLAIAWVQLIVTLAIIIVTVLKFYKNSFEDIKKIKKTAVVSTISFVFIQTLLVFLSEGFIKIITEKEIYTLNTVFNLVYGVFDWIGIITLTLTLLNASKIIYIRKQEKREKSNI